MNETAFNSHFHILMFGATVLSDFVTLSASRNSFEFPRGCWFSLCLPNAQRDLPLSGDIMVTRERDPLAQSLSLYNCYPSNPNFNRKGKSFNGLKTFLKNCFS